MSPIDDGVFQNSVPDRDLYTSDSGMTRKKRWRHLTGVSWTVCTFQRGQNLSTVSWSGFPNRKSFSNPSDEIAGI